MVYLLLYCIKLPYIAYAHLGFVCCSMQYSAALCNAARFIVERAAFACMLAYKSLCRTLMICLVSAGVGAPQIPR